MWHFPYQHPVKLFHYLHDFLKGTKFSMRLSGRALAALLILSLFCMSFHIILVSLASLGHLCPSEL